MVAKYTPKQKDIVYVDFNPTKGHEQKGYRPAVVISTDTFNKFTKMVIVCPITSNTKEFPTHHLLKETKQVTGSVLCEYIRSIDYEDRKLKFVEKMTDNDFGYVMSLIEACLSE